MYGIRLEIVHAVAHLTVADLRMMFMPEKNRTHPSRPRDLPQLRPPSLALLQLSCLHLRHPARRSSSSFSVSI